ncbi:MAG: hypothetical protein WBN02_20090 [Sedimenticolaceae bacterium]
MRIVPIGILLILLTAPLTGCNTFGAIKGAPLGQAIDTGASEESELSAIYRQLHDAPIGRFQKAAFPDGFGSGGITVVKHYFSASGKHCTVVAETSSGRWRTICQNNAGITNAFSSPENSEPL